MSRLKNGLRVVTYKMPYIHSVTSCVLVGIGSRYEANKQAGISHFLEHIFFKGTKNRPKPVDIYRSMESIGGYANAATGQEMTCFYNILPKRHYAKGIEFLGDIINNSLFKEDDIDRERDVILQELDMRLDDPGAYIYDLIEELVWSKQALGRSVIGNKESIRGLTRKDFVSYVEDFYQPQNMIFCVAGDVKHDIIKKEVEKYFEAKVRTRKTEYISAKDKQNGSKVLVYKKKTDQAYLCFGFRSLPYNHKDEASLAVLNTILGEGMSSRLFLNIREDKGLAYSINSFVEKFRDTGLLGVSAGVNPGKVKEAIREILNEFRYLQTDLVPAEDLLKAKEFLKGRLILQMDDGDRMSAWYGFQVLFCPKIKTPQERIKSIEKVTARDIQRLAKIIFNMKKINLAVIGPFNRRDEDGFRRLLG